MFLKLKSKFILFSHYYYNFRSLPRFYVNHPKSYQTIHATLCLVRSVDLRYISLNRPLTIKCPFDVMGGIWCSCPSWDLLPWGHQGTPGVGWGCTGGPCRSSESVSVGYTDTNAAGGGAALKWVTWSGDYSRGSADAQFRSITLQAPTLCVKPGFIHNYELQQVESTSWAVIESLIGVKPCRFAL